MPSKVVIIGNSGAGKSHLASAMAAAWRLPAVDLDRLFWVPGSFSQKRPNEIVRAELDAKKVEPAWIVEGVFGELAVCVLDRAELLVWLDLDWNTCRSALLARGYAFSNEHERTEMEASFQRLLVWAEAYWTRDGFRSHSGHHGLFDSFSGTKLRFSSRRAIDDYIDKIMNQPNQRPDRTRLDAADISGSRPRA